MANFPRDLFKFTIFDANALKGQIVGPGTGTFGKAFGFPNLNLVYPLTYFGIDMELTEATGLYPPSGTENTPNNIKAASGANIIPGDDNITLKWRCMDIDKLYGKIPVPPVPEGYSHWFSWPGTQPWKVGSVVTLYTDGNTGSDSDFYKRCVVVSRDVVRNVNAPYLSLTLAPLHHGWIKKEQYKADGSFTFSAPLLSPAPFTFEVSITANAVNNMSIEIAVTHEVNKILPYIGTGSKSATVQKIKFSGISLEQTTAEKTFIFDSTNPLEASIKQGTTVIPLAPYLVNVADGMHVSSPNIYIPAGGRVSVKITATNGAGENVIAITPPMVNVYMPRD